METPMWLPMWLCGESETEWETDTLCIIERKLLWWHLYDCGRVGIGLGVLYVITAMTLDLPDHFNYIWRYLCQPIDAYELWARLGWFIVACPAPVLNPILPAFAGYVSTRIVVEWSGIQGRKAAVWGGIIGALCFQLVTFWLAF